MEDPTELVERLADEAAAALGAAAPGMASLPAAGLVALTAAIERLGRVADAARAAAAWAAETRSSRSSGTAGLAQSLGYRTAADLVEQAAGVPGAEARRRIRLGGLVCPRQDAVGAPLPALYPRVGAAMASGALGAEAARAIATELQAAGDRAHPGALALAERLLVAAATGADDTATPEELARAGLTEDEAAEAALAGRGAPGVPLPADAVAARARVWRDVLDPDGVEPRADLARHNRQLTLSRIPAAGLHTLRGRLTPDVAAGLFAFFDTLIARPDPDTAPWDSPAPPDRRNHAQRCHDLLAGLIRAAGAAVNACPPHTASAGNNADADGRDGDADTGRRDADRRDAGGATETGPSEAGPARAATLPVPVPVPLIVTADTAQLARGEAGTGTISGIHGRIPLSYLAQLACDGGLQPLLTDHGRPLQLRTPGRFFTPAQRRAAAVRDGTTCVIPGCDMPFPALEAHHVTPFSHGGPTAVDNCALLCWWHHHLIDAGIWEVHMIRGKPRIRVPIRSCFPLAA